MAEAPAAAAAANGAPVPQTAPHSPQQTQPSTPSGKSPAPFDARLQLAKSLHPARVAMPEAAAGGGSEPDGDGAAEPDEPAADGGGDGAADPDGAADGDGDGADGAADGEPSSPQAALDAVTKAFDSGDIEAMAAALKKAGAKVAGPVRRAFRAHARRQRQADERDRQFKDTVRNFDAAKARAQHEIADDTRRVAAQERQLIQKFGWAHQLERAWDDEDMTSFGKVLEKACKGASLATITQKLATGKQGKTADERRIADKERELQEREQALQRTAAQKEDAKTTAQRREAAITRVGEGLKSHPYLQMTDAQGKAVQDPEALAEVFTAYEASWNGEKFTKTARACADELQEKLLARAKARGLAPPPPPPAAGGKRPPAGKKPPAPRSGLKEPPRAQSPTRGTPADLDSSRANRVAAARRMVEMQRRGVVG
jgi:hypothetical protein